MRLPAKDRYHDTVVRALIKEGWTITNEQYTIFVEERVLWIDIRAVKQAQDLVILVEVKGFENMPSAVNYLADAIGKYVLYRASLKYLRDQAPLYLAVPQAAYAGILSEKIGQQLIQEENVWLMIFNPETEEIVQWIP
jgi:hypothetical protein